MYWNHFYLILMALIFVPILSGLWVWERRQQRKTFLPPAFALLIMLWCISHVQTGHYHNNKQWSIYQKQLMGTWLYKQILSLEELYKGKLMKINKQGLVQQKL